jgi:hypothetical protein
MILATLAPASARPAAARIFHASGQSARGSLTPPVMDGDTFTYDYTTSLDERIDKKPFKELFKGATTTTVMPLHAKVSGQTIQFEFYSQGGDIGNSDIMGALVNFTPSGGSQSEVVWGYGASVNPTSSFQTASPGFSTPYVVDAYPEAAGASWTSNGTNLSEYNVQNFIRTSYYEVGFIDTRSSGEALRDDIYAAASTIGSNSDDRADGSGRLSVVPANQNAKISTFELPVRMGSAWVIPVTTNGSTVDVPDWFPGGAQPPKPISNDTFSIAAPVTTPRECGKMARITADDLHETVVVVSVTHGTVAQRDTHYYDTTAGTICRVEHILVDEYGNLTDGKLNGTVKITTVEQLVGSTLIRRLAAGSGSSGPFRSNFTNQEFVPEVSFGPKFLF